MNIVNSYFTIHVGNRKLAPGTCLPCGSEVHLLHPFASHEFPRPSGIRDRDLQRESMKETGGKNDDQLSQYAFLAPEFQLLNEEQELNLVSFYCANVNILDG